MTAPSRLFVGVLAYNWETREKRLYQNDETCPPVADLLAEGFRVYLFSGNLPEDLSVQVSPEKIEATLTEDDESRDMLEAPESLAGFIYKRLCRYLPHLLPGRLYAPYGKVITHYNDQSLSLRTRFGGVVISVRGVDDVVHPLEIPETK